MDLEDFWSIESIGVKNENEEVLDDEIVMKKFKDEVIFEDGRYQVTWPRKIPIYQAINNWHLVDLNHVLRSCKTSRSC